MGSTPDRGDVVTADLTAASEPLRARRIELAAAGFHLAAADLDGERDELRRGRTGLDVATIERLRTPS